jgi:hypothetical protein
MTIMPTTPGIILRGIACASLIVAQGVVAARCDACAEVSADLLKACGGCIAVTGEASRPGCPACVAEASCGDHPATAPSPCRCQLEPRHEVPLVPPQAVSFDMEAGPVPTAWLGDDFDGRVVDTAAVDRLIDAPRRPVRILLGVWRN